MSRICCLTDHIHRFYWCYLFVYKSYHFFMFRTHRKMVARIGRLKNFRKRAEFIRITTVIWLSSASLVWKFINFYCNPLRFKSRIQYFHSPSTGQPSGDIYYQPSILYLTLSTSLLVAPSATHALIQTSNNVLTYFALHLALLLQVCRCDLHPFLIMYISQFCQIRVALHYIMFLFFTYFSSGVLKAPFCFFISVYILSWNALIMGSAERDKNSSLLKGRRTSTVRCQKTKRIKHCWGDRRTSR